MNTTLHLLARTAAAGLLALGIGAASAQPASAPNALPSLGASAASAPAPTQPVGPRLRSPAETGNRATAPGDLRPERPVSPQISIPIGKPVPADGPNADRRVLKRPAPPTTGSIDDAAARCESQVDDTLRADCRARLAREAKGKLPN